MTLTQTRETPWRPAPRPARGIALLIAAIAAGGCVVEATRDEADDAIDDGDDAYGDLDDDAIDGMIAAARVVPIPRDGDWPAALAALRPGDVAQLEPGRYRAPGGKGTARVTIRGTPDAPIVIRGAGTRGSIFDGQSGNAALTLVDSRDVILENVVFTNPSPYGIDGRVEYKGDSGRAKKAEGLIVRGGARITVRRSKFVDIATRGILANTDVDRLRVVHNLFLRVGDDTASGDINLTSGARRWVIRENLFAGNVDGVVGHYSGAGGLIERNLFMFLKWENCIDLKHHGQAAGESPWSVIRSNVFYTHGNRFTGIAFQMDSANLEFSGNVVHGAAWRNRSAMTISSNERGTRNAVVVGNWFDGGGSPADARGLVVERNAVDAWILHNVFTGWTGSRHGVWLDGGRGITVANNVLDRSRAGHGGAASFTARRNLYGNVARWSADASPLDGTPVYAEAPVGPLAPGSPGKGQAAAIAGHAWGPDVGIPAAFAGLARLEPSILAQLEKHFSRAELREAYDQAGLTPRWP